MDYVYTNFNETIGKAFADKTDAVAGLQAWQDARVKYAKDQGFTVVLTLGGARRRTGGGHPRRPAPWKEPTMSTAVDSATGHASDDRPPAPTRRQRRQAAPVRRRLRSGRCRSS